MYWRTNFGEENKCFQHQTVYLIIVNDQTVIALIKAFNTSLTKIHL